MQCPGKDGATSTPREQWKGREYHLIWGPQGDELDVAVIIEHRVALTDPVKTRHQPLIVLLVQPPPHRDAGANGAIAKNRNLQSASCSD